MKVLPGIVLTVSTFALCHALEPPRAAEAHANVAGATSDRYFIHSCSGTNYLEHWAHPGAVPIYVNNSSTRGVQRLGKVGGGTWTVAEVERMVKQTVIEMNESAGIPIRLYYAGPTASSTVDGGIVVRSKAGTDPEGYLGTGGSTPSCAPFPGAYVRGVVEAHPYSSSGLRAWTYRENGLQDGPDFLAFLQHELGHAIGLAHPTDVLVTNLGTRYSPLSVMNWSAPYGRHFTRYDRETLWALYGTRNATFNSWVSGSAQGYGTSWITGDNTNTSWAPMIRMGKLSEGAFATHVAWIARTTAFLAGMAKYASGVEQSMSLPTTTSYSPPAIVSGSTSPTALRMYYLERDGVYVQGNETFEYYNNFKRICWMQSSDGASWSPGGCLTHPSTGADLSTWAESVNATFDPLRKLWVVTWIDDEYRVWIHTTPGPGSTVTAPRLTYTGHQSWKTPAIACSNNTNGCHLVFVSQSYTWYLITQRGGFDSVGAWSNSTSFASGNDLDQYAAPSVSWQPWNQRFVLTYLKDDQRTLRSYRKTLTATSWTDQATVSTAPTGTAYSAPAIGWDQPCFLGCGDPRSFIGALRYPN